MPTFGEYFKDLGVTISTESLMSGKLEQEIEYTMYVELNDLVELKRKAINVEKQEQWLVCETDDPVNGKVRIRLINDSRPTMCTKIKREEGIGSEEVEFDIPMASFKHLKEMSTGGIVKTRYSVPSNIQGLVWEIDVFLNQAGGESPWVKVDLEVKSLNDPIPNFPLDHSRVIYADGDLTHSEKLKIQSLWDKEWCGLGR